MLRWKILIALALFCASSYAQNKSLNDKYEGYLFAYFEGSGKGDEQEQLRFAVSNDGFNWAALNKNRPILSSSKIALSGGIRDPHILRLEKGDGFLVSATDMNTHKNGWGQNNGIVLLKSKDLISWKSSAIDFIKVYPKMFSNVQWVWAPQTIYDPLKRKYLIYFTVKFKNDQKLDFYASYINKDFTGFENPPKLLFSPKFGAIDGDIVLKGDTYHLFFKGNTKVDGKEVKNGIQQATSKSLQGPWKEDFKYLDVYADKGVSVEGSSVFKLNNSSEYILMYDLYTQGKYEYQTSTDLFNFSASPKSFTKNFNPRHGSVIGITRKEARLLHTEWGGVQEELLQPIQSGDKYQFQSTGNPLFAPHYTADPAAFVEGDTFWLYAGHDFKGGQNGYKMKDWLVFSTKDLKNWTEYPVPLKITDFSWAKSGDAYAGQVIKKNDKYYWYISTNWSGIGVGVSDRPEGPFKDALGKPLLTNEDCKESKHAWACIDPSVYIDEQGQGWIFWGNGECYYAKLKSNMIEIDGEIKRIQFDKFDFTEAPWIHKKDDTYYLSYATGFPEKIAYATSKSITGPWKYQGILNEIAGNSNTNHQAIVEFRNKWFFVYHNGAIQTDGGSYSRSICVDEMKYNSDGTIAPIVMTSKGFQF